MFSESISPMSTSGSPLLNAENVTIAMACEVTLDTKVIRVVEADKERQKTFFLFNMMLVYSRAHINEAVSSRSSICTTQKHKRKKI